ncbi:MAG: YcgN family cysteine cluster protein [Deltaproteobacteria bacterium]|nr:YcgN family cysteine cluster protein [Deltaproteobacteria bacterium]TLN03552.1 MAG: YcgN family cysteine cluster protein [bacterium]
MKKSSNSSDNWEDLCEKCGICCFEKIENDNGTIFFTATPCRYLDVVTRECKIYPRRFEIYPECVQLTETLVQKLNWLHDDCGYRKAFGLKRRT